MAKTKRGAKNKKVSKTEDVKPEIKTEETEIKNEAEDTTVESKNEVKKVIKLPKGKKGKALRYFSKDGKSKKDKPARGVVYVSSLPHGFYDKQLEGYFGQFGKVTGIYVPKSKKTGRSKGYGFVEFHHPEVAQIAAETMNNYLMFNRLIKTKLIPPEKQKPYMFSDRYKKMKHRFSESKVTQSVNKRRGLIKRNRDSYITRSMRKLTSIQDSLKNLGVDYKIKVAGLHEDVKLTSLKRIDPEEEVTATKKPQEVSTDSKQKVTSKNKKGKKKSKAAKVSPTPVKANVKETSQTSKAVVPSMPNVSTKQKPVKKMAKFVVKQQLAAGKEKVAKLTKTIGKSKIKVESNVKKALKKKPSNTLKSIDKNKAKKVASPVKRKGGKAKAKLETTV